jgi:hypothetical protein
LTALQDDAALAADAIRAAIEHLRTARQLLKQTAALMQKNNSTPLPRDQELSLDLDRAVEQLQRRLVGFFAHAHTPYVCVENLP